MEKQTLEQTKINLANWQNNYMSSRAESIKSSGKCGLIIYIVVLLIFAISIIPVMGIGGLFLTGWIALVMYGLVRLNKRNAKDALSKMIEPEAIKIYGAICESVEEDEDVDTSTEYLTVNAILDGCGKKVQAFALPENGGRIQSGSRIIVANISRYRFEYYAEKLKDIEIDRLDVYEEE